MERYIGLLRGINVGGRGKLPMKSLIEICNEIGFVNTRSYIQSGNIVFDMETKPNPETLSAAILKAHDFSPKVMFINATRFKQIAAHNPFASDIAVENHKFLQQFFLGHKPENIPVDKLDAMLAEGERWSTREDCFYLYSPDGIHKSKIASGIEKWLGVPATARNWKTISKLREMIA